MKATLVRQYDHPPPIASAFEGGEQALPGGDTFVGWGQQPYFTEFDADGKANFDAHFTVPTSTYRAYRFPWSAQPPTTPALAAANGLNVDAGLSATVDRPAIGNLIQKRPFIRPISRPAKPPLTGVPSIAPAGER